MTFEETMNSIRTQRKTIMRKDLKATHVAFGFAEWDDFRRDANSGHVVHGQFDGSGRTTIMGMRVVLVEGGHAATVLSDGALYSIY